jgi:hypothetical protein
MTVMLVACFFISLGTFAQKFPPPPENLPSTNYFGPDIFKLAEKETGIQDEALELYINEETDQFRALLDSLDAGWTAPAMTHINLRWNLSPEAEDQQKQAVIDKVLTQLPRLANLKNRSRLKSITFSIGEGMFIMSKDKLEYYNSKGRKENMRRSAMAVQKELNALPFKLDVYAETWGW